MQQFWGLPVPAWSFECFARCVGAMCKSANCGSEHGRDVFIVDAVFERVRCASSTVNLDVRTMVLPML